jgi:AraC-like DNA-binding protein
MENEFSYFSNILLFLGAIFSFFSFFIFVSLNHKNKKSAKILSAFMAISFIFLFSYISELFGFSIANILKYIYIPFLLALPPVFYFYIKSLTVNNVKFTDKILLHFIPSAVVFIFIIMLYGYYPDYPSGMLINNGISEFWDSEVLPVFAFGLEFFVNYLFYFQFVIYFIVIVLMLIRHRKNIKKYFSSVEKKQLNWILSLIILLLIILLVLLTIEYTLTLNFEIYDFIYNMSFTAFLVYLTYFGLKQNDIYRELHEIEKETEKIPETIITKDEIKTRTLTINETKAEELKNNIEELFKDDKIYLDAELNLAQIAKITGSNRHYLSQVFNEKIGTTFYQYTNTFRTEEAIRMLENKENAGLSIIEICELSGFKSRSTFNKLFKERTGLTPAQYRKANKD